MRTVWKNRLRDDDGIAMMTVIMVMVVLVALGMAAVGVSTLNLTNTGRDRRAMTALGAAEAAISRAEAYLQSSNPNALSCSPSCGTTNVWGNSDPTKQLVLTFSGGRTAKVWIEVMQGYAPPSYKSGIYKIHAVGYSSNSVGVRTLEQTVSVAPLNFPLGIYVDNKINNGGTSGVTNESMFSNSCIDSRGNMQFLGTDPYYGVPAGAHSAQYITVANQSVCDSDVTHEQKTDTKALHYDKTGGLQHNYCATAYPYDQDSIGGDFSADNSNGSSCTSTSLNPPQYWTSSAFDTTTLTNTYGYVKKGLTDAQYALLKTAAQASGTYYTSGSLNGVTLPSASTNSNPVLYFDLQPGQSLSLQNELNTYGWQTDTNCTMQHSSVIIVVRGGDMSVGSSTTMTGALFVPEGTLTYAGGAALVGTIFAANLKMTGNSNISLNSCYAKSTPGPILSVSPIRFREVDR